MAIGLIDLYKVLFSSLLGSLVGSRCRFTPTCSSYAREAFNRYGFIVGLAKTVGRLCRCHPFGCHGYDPVDRLPNSKRISDGT